jgi:hypothetical protein
VCFSEEFAMSKLFTGFAAAALAVAFSVPGTVQPDQANAAPAFLPKTVNAQSDVIQVRDGWYRGYRGYRGYRYGYRNYNGWWYPAGAFVAGALIGGAIANSNSYYGDGYYGRRYYDDGYYPRYYAPRYYAPERVYYPPRGTAYRQGYRDGYRDGVNARYRNDITCTPRLADAGQC